MRSRRYAKAEGVRRDDVGRFPDRSWTLFDPGRAVRPPGKNAQAGAVEARLKKARAGVDVALTTVRSCNKGV